MRESSWARTQYSSAWAGRAAIKAFPPGSNAAKQGAPAGAWGTRGLQSVNYEAIFPPLARSAVRKRKGVSRHACEQVMSPFREW